MRHIIEVVTKVLSRLVTHKHFFSFLASHNGNLGRIIEALSRKFTYKLKRALFYTQSVG
jgi:hypothetical protein